MLGSNPSDRLSGRKGRGRAALVPFDEIKNIHSGGKKATNPGGLGACVREDLMDLLIERNQLR